MQSPSRRERSGSCVVLALASGDAFRDCDGLPGLPEAGRGRAARGEVAEEGLVLAVEAAHHEALVRIAGYVGHDAPALEMVEAPRRVGPAPHRDLDEQDRKSVV